MRPVAGAEIIFLINLYCSQFGGYITVLSGNIWQELEPEPKLWTKVGPKRSQK